MSSSMSPRETFVAGGDQSLGLAAYKPPSLAASLASSSHKNAENPSAADPLSMFSRQRHRPLHDAVRILGQSAFAYMREISTAGTSIPIERLSFWLDRTATSQFPIYGSAFGGDVSASRSNDSVSALRNSAHGATAIGSTVSSTSASAASAAVTAQAVSLTTRSASECAEIDLVIADFVADMVHNGRSYETVSSLLMHTLVQLRCIQAVDFVCDITDLTRYLLVITVALLKHLAPAYLALGLDAQLKPPSIFALTEAYSRVSNTPEPPASTAGRSKNKDTRQSIGELRTVALRHILSDSLPRHEQLLHYLFLIIARLDISESPSSYIFLTDCIRSLYELFSSQITVPRAVNSVSSNIFLQSAVHRIRILPQEVVERLLTLFITAPNQPSTSLFGGVVSYLMGSASTLTSSSSSSGAASTALSSSSISAAGTKSKSSGKIIQTHSALLILLLCSQVTDNSQNHFLTALRNVNNITTLHAASPSISIKSKIRTTSDASVNGDSIHIGISFSLLLDSIQSLGLMNETACMLLVLLLSQNTAFRNFLLSRTDPDVFLLPFMQTLTVCIEDGPLQPTSVPVGQSLSVVSSQSEYLSSVSPTRHASHASSTSTSVGAIFSSPPPKLSLSAAGVENSPSPLIGISSASPVSASVTGTANALPVMGAVFNFRQFYLLCAILVQLSSDDAYCQDIQKATVDSQQWISDKNLKVSGMSLGVILMHVVVRCIQHNLSVWRDSFINQCALSALCNLSGSIQNIPTALAQRLIAVFELVSKRYHKLYARIQSELPSSASTADASDLSKCPSYADFAVFQDMLLSLLHAFCTIIRQQVNGKNEPFIYALLQSRDLYPSLQKHPRMTKYVDEISLVIAFFQAHLSIFHGSTPEMSMVLKMIGTAASKWANSSSQADRNTQTGKTSQRSRTVSSTASSSNSLRISFGIVISDDAAVEFMCPLAWILARDNRCFVCSSASLGDRTLLLSQFERDMIFAEPQTVQSNRQTLFSKPQ